MHKKLRLVVGLAAALLALPATAAAKPADVEVQLLALNDFHGHIGPETPGTIKPFDTGAGSTSPNPDPTVVAGGAAYLATHIRALEKRNPNSLFVSAGDLIGASPLISALFHDEPTIEAMNLMGLDLNAVGNHEFDEGAVELRRMQEGGCHPVDGCYDGPDADALPDGFGGAKFGFLAANVVDTDTGEPIFAPYAIRKLGGIKVGFIGMTLEGTPDIVSQAGIQGLTFRDEADTANEWAQVLREQHGVEAIVVLLHEGGAQTLPFGLNECNGFTGPIVDIVTRTTDAVDLFVTGHTHQPYNCVIDGRPVSSSASFGRLITDIDLTLDQDTKDVSAVSINNRIVTQTVKRDMQVNDLVEHYRALAAPLANRVIGWTNGPLLRAQVVDESPLGNVIADAQLGATDDAAGAVAAFMNPGGIRADLNAGTTGAAEVTYGEAFTVQPFGNSLVTMDLTGAQLDLTLEQQWCTQAVNPNGTIAARILSVSDGVTYTWDGSASIPPSSCTRVSGLAIDGVPVDPAATYRVTVNSFLADGGDRFFVLRQGTNRAGGDLDLDAFEKHFAGTTQANPLPTPALNRITRVN
jgi:5'-nucleotidase